MNENNKLDQEFQQKLKRGDDLSNTAVNKILDSNQTNGDKIVDILALNTERQEASTGMMQQGFIGLAVQNNELQQKLEAVQEQLNIVTRELEERKKQELLALEKRNRRKNRLRLPLKDPVTEEIYEFLIDRATKLYGETYQGARLRLAITLLTITGIRISELLPLKGHQIKTLFEHSWIKIDRLKKGPANHKAFLTKADKLEIKKRHKDFEIVQYAKPEDACVFTAQYSSKPLTREAFNRIVNNFLNDSIKELPYRPNIKSHSFRAGFITQLWKDTNDIEFIRQTIGHAKLDTTSKYVQTLTAEERESRIRDL